MYNPNDPTHVPRLMLPFGRGRQDGGIWLLNLNEDDLLFDAFRLAGYITNAKTHGMQMNDLVLVRRPANGQLALGSVKEVKANGMGVLGLLMNFSFPRTDDLAFDNSGKTIAQLQALTDEQYDDILDATAAADVP